MIKKVTRLKRLALRRPNPLLTDPTGTGLEQRALEREITRRFRNLKREITKFIVHEDAFGLRDKLHGSLSLNDFCPTGKGGGIDPTCSPGGKKQFVYDKGHWETGEDPRGLPSDHIAYDPPIKWVQEHTSLLRDAIESWKGSNTDMGLHIRDELSGVKIGDSGTDKIMRAQAAALLRELRENSKPAPKLYRGDNKSPSENSSNVLGWTSSKKEAARWAKKYKGEVYELDGASGLEIEKVLGVRGTIKESEWLVLHNIPTTNELSLNDFCPTGKGGGVEYELLLPRGFKPKAIKRVNNSLAVNKAASTQVNILDPAIITRIMDIQSSIDPQDVIELDDNPHITIRYGLEDIDPERVEKIVKQYQSIDVELGGLSLFENDEQDVLKIDVKSKALRSINSHLGILPNTQTFNKYVPHLTVAYLKSGTGIKYVGKSGLEKTRLTFQSMIYSDVDRNHTSISLNQKSRYIELSFNASSCGAGAEGSPGFQPGNTCGSGGGNGIKLPPQVDTNIERSRGIISGFLAGEGYRKQILMDNGADADAIDEMDKLFDQHRWGESHQAIADAKIAEEINKNTPLGKALRIQSAVETELLDRYEKARGGIADKAEKQSKYDMKEAWEMGWGPKNNDAYSSWEEQWEVEESDNVKHIREPLKFYRKGGLDKDVIPTSTNKYGAQSHAVIGSQSAQPHFVPTTEKTSAEMKAAGYQVLGGLGYIQMGYLGENEITWVKVKPLVTNTLATNAPFSFLSSEEKLNGFAAWLKERVFITVLAKHFLRSAAQQQDHWLTQYINKTFLGGMGKMFDYFKRSELQESLDFYKGTKAQFLESAFARPPAVERVKLLASRAFNELQGVTDQMATQMQRTLVDGFIRGDSPFTIARDLNQAVDDIGIKRARVIARTEIVRSHNLGRIETMEAQGMDKVGVAVEWSTSRLGTSARGNPSPCKLCAPLAGVVLKLDEARTMFPRHPNCVVGESHIVAGDVLTLMKAHYTGEIIEFVTGKGRRLSVTPNHILLTEYGLVPARFISKGAYIVNTGWGEGVAVNNPDDDRGIPAISDVFASLWKSSSVKSVCVPLSSEDLHGDGGSCNEKISIIYINRELGDNFKRDRIIERLFQPIHFSDELKGLRSLSEFLNRTGFTSNAGGTKLRDALAFILGHLLVRYVNGFASVTNFNSNTYESASYGWPTNTELFRKCFSAHPIMIQLHDFIDWYGDMSVMIDGIESFLSQMKLDGVGLYSEFSSYVPAGHPTIVQSDNVLIRERFGASQVSPKSNSILAEPVYNRPVADFETISERFDGASGLIGSDKVVDVNIKHVVDLPVYDVQTECSLYQVNGVVSSNCMCTLIPSGVGESTEGQKRTERSIQSAVAKSLKAERGKSKRSIEQQRKRSRWSGATTKVSKKRPKPIV